LVNPMNTTPLLIKSFFPPKGAKEGGGSKEGADSSTGGQQDKKLAEVGDTKDTGDDKAFQKQEEALISANQKNGYEGVMEKIESYAPYEDLESEPIRVVAPSSKSKSASPTSDQSQSQLVTVGGGGGEDPYEVLEAFG